MVHPLDAPTPGAHDQPDRPHRTDAGAPPESSDLEDASLVDVARHLTETLDAEHVLIRRIVLGIVIAVPVAIAVVLVMVVIALGADNVNWDAPIIMAVALGILAGVFFGAWAGFVSTAHAFEHLDGPHPGAGPGATSAPTA